ncbi:MBL fold metallo-hydrolase [Aquimarina sediminis]|uniref:MBL fold metallo-hydrolase n=1 Tax=Aquimarina sediminis TaxID=2070536 RepID=UPI000CA03F94|nr:MBL fold metallo-hydrolase [Aquimarina sediminis]
MSLKNTQTIKVDELRTLLENKTPIRVLDIRPQEEREEWKIVESEFVDVYHQLKSGTKNLFSDHKFSPDIPVVTVCGAGKTSMIAMKQLREKGVEAYSLEGGMREWTKAWNTAQTKDNNGTTIIQIRRTGKGCLSYILENNGEVIIIDPSLTSEVYSTIATKNNWDIKYIIDTHIHADHFSRGRQLADKENAMLFLPNQNIVNYAFNAINQNTTFEFGKATLKAIHTPGHTHESYCYLLDNQALFSGDTLFTSGVGRPDLKATTEVARKKSSLLYQSLQKLLALDNTLAIYPGHISNPVAFDDQLISGTLGDIKNKVQILQLSEKEFIDNLLQNIPETPPNYEEIVKLNIKGTAKEADLIELEAGANRCAIS